MNDTHKKCLKLVLALLCTQLLSACGGDHPAPGPAGSAIRKQSRQITIDHERMAALVKELASAKYNGRLAGSQGDKLTQAYLLQQFKELGLLPANQHSYLQSFSSTIVEPDGESHGNPANPMLGSKVQSNNILGLLPGSDPVLKHQVIIVSAHHDHLGWTNDGRYYPGANDDLSGLAAMLELARAFKTLAQTGSPPRRSLLFVAYGAEEQHEMGSMYHAAHPLPDFPNDAISLMISIDMIGQGYQAWRQFTPEQTASYVDSWMRQMQNQDKDDSDEFSHEYPPQDGKTFSYDAGPFAQLGINNRVFGLARGIPHYHQVSDTWEHVDYQSAAVFTQAIFEFLRQVDLLPAKNSRPTSTGKAKPPQ